jgi:ferredoxin
MSTSTLLQRSNDRKVANCVSPSGKVLIANTFGLPAGANFSCTHATGFCSKICYAGNIERVYPSVRGVLERNWEALKNATYADMVIILDAMIADFVKDCDKRQAPKLFRIHWDGDFFKGEYTAAWSKVIRAYPDVQFWVYTRVPSAALFLHALNLDNLSLYFSADPDNLEQARILEAVGVLIAYVDETFDKGKQEFPSATRCPENNKAIPLITPKGSACARCGLCINGRKSVLFSTTKK